MFVAVFVPNSYLVQLDPKFIPPDRALPQGQGICLEGPTMSDFLNILY